MSGVYSKRFLSFAGDGNAHAATVPAGKVWIISDVSVASAQPGQTVNAAAAGPAPINFFLWSNAATPNWLSAHWTGHLVLSAGEQVTGFVTANLGSMVVSGYELSA